MKVPQTQDSESGCRAQVGALLRQGASPNQTADKGGETALHKAAAYGHVSVMRILLHASADPNAVCNQARRTALHVAAQMGQLSAVTVLPRAAHLEGRGGWGGRAPPLAR